MQKDVAVMNTTELKQYLLGNASVSHLGSQAEAKLQQTPDYQQCKDQIFANQRKIAFWDGMRNYGTLAAGIFSGMLGGAIGAALGAQSNAAPAAGDGAAAAVANAGLNNPLLYIGAAGAAGFTGLSIYSNYRNGIIQNQNNFCIGEAGARKGAEMGKLHAMTGHEASLATTEYNAKRMGEEVEKAMERSFARHHAKTETPSCTMMNVDTVVSNQQAALQVTR